MSLTVGNTSNHLLDRLSKADFALIKASLVEASVGNGEVLGRPGLELEMVWFPVSAVLSVVTLLQEGQSVEACTIGHESAYGLLNALGAAISINQVIVQVPGAAVRMPIAKLKAAAAQSASLAEAMVRHVQANLAQTQQSVACNAVHHVEARLCRWLLMSQDRTRNGKLPLTQEFLGLMLGVSRTTVTVAARALQSAGLIRYVRGQIDILDREGLEEGACECYAAVLEKQVQLVGPHLH